MNNNDVHEYYQFYYYILIMTVQSVLLITSYKYFFNTYNLYGLREIDYDENFDLQEKNHKDSKNI